MHEGDAAPAAAAAAAVALPQPELPLCERPAQHAVPLGDLLAWREAAEGQVQAVGNAWVQQDDGPSVEDLQVLPLLLL